MSRRNLIHPRLSLLSLISDAETGEPRAFFSWSPCDCCGDTFGGERYSARALYVDKRRRSPALRRCTYSVCPSCLQRWS